ncbi:MAG: hypothetical protein N0E45_20965 [Candidatus Thiodiazotropha endolucinida]|nr:hypothetical protein [Candidatus Thiodiazotropha taylori]MCG8121390.1 hypothetical protein [Candidatus Thiodiazotropha taylori]MCW4297083.1 hypothetical protein [Candidatus Thiodiazotropha endolucinida]MCW4302106.1 hypothetical protein [Candidatus Thiodiazotropha endolucinida]
MKYMLFAMLVVFSLSAVAGEKTFRIKPGKYLEIRGDPRHNLLWIDLFTQLDWNYLSSTSPATGQNRYQLFGGWKKIGVDGKVQLGRYIKLTLPDRGQRQSPILTLYNRGVKSISGSYETIHEEDETFDHYEENEIYYSDDELIKD